MNFKEFYDFQMKSCLVMRTEEDLKNLNQKQYYSGREIKVGDRILMGVIVDNDPKNSLPGKIITLHPDELGTMYVQDDRMTKSNIGIDLPVLKKIK